MTWKGIGDTEGDGWNKEMNGMRKMDGIWV